MKNQEWFKQLGEIGNVSGGNREHLKKWFSARGMSVTDDELDEVISVVQKVSLQPVSASDDIMDAVAGGKPSVTKILAILGTAVVALGVSGGAAWAIDKKWNEGKGFDRIKGAFGKKGSATLLEQYGDEIIDNKGGDLGV
jgi:hypothetical protein